MKLDMTRSMVLCCLFLFMMTCSVCHAGDARPNILWLTCEDIGPQLGCYGDGYADTPNLDRLAERGVLYRFAWSTAPVCAPARTTIISGVYPPSTGSQHMRSFTHLPDGMKMYPQYLREAGYYCTNNSKEDYNLKKPGKVWDESSRNAHWKNRKPGQPFFAIFNHTGTHESRIRKRPHECVHDPDKAPLPAYHPDTPAVRKDWAQYYDNITRMDAWAAEKLKEVADAGLADDTIVFFYGDHGSGMPRGKRCACDSGLRVPMLVHVPPKFKHLASRDYGKGVKSDRLVGFIDLAPTALSLAGIKPPAHMQGHAFLGSHEAPPQPYMYGFRGRMDERYDFVRTVRDQRYVYVRNYMPHLPMGQHVRYMFVTPTTRVWRELYDKGELNKAQSLFWQPTPSEELYDMEADPWEVNNLAGSPAHQKILERFRKAQQEKCRAIRDLGFLPEPQIHSRAGDGAPYDMGHDAGQYPLERIMATAEAASMLSPEATSKLIAALDDADSAVRYWAAMGMLMRGSDAVKKAHGGLVKALKDPAPCVRLAAAWALAEHGPKADLDKALSVLLDLGDGNKHGIHLALMAGNALDYLDGKAAGVVDRIKALPKKAPNAGRSGYGLAPLLEKTVADLKETASLKTASGRKKPNVVIVFLDDSGWADFKPFGKPSYPTPNVRKLADGGCRFNNFYVPQAVCSASRAALLTGCYPGRTKMFGAHGPNARGVDPRFATLGEVLKAAGYRTAVFGKWHIGDQPETRPAARGFDESCGLMYSNDMWKYHPGNPKYWGKHPLQFWKNNKVIDEEVDKADQTQLTTAYTEHAVDFINRHHERPFFLYVPHSMPHVPLFCSDKFLGKSGAGLYGDVMMEIDWSVGEIMKALKKNGIEDNTLVMFTSDNGPWVSYGNHAGTTPFREAKGTSFDGGVRSACIVKYPAGIKAGTVSDRAFCTLDVLPTVAHLAGASLPDNPVDGKNVWDVMAGKPGAENPNAYYPFSIGSRLEGVISGDGRWKLHLPHGYRTLGKAGNDGLPGPYKSAKIGLSLFDMKNDPHETTNVLEKYPDVAARMKKYADRHRETFYGKKKKK